MMVTTRTTLTPEQRLEQAQHQLEETKTALEQAKVNTTKAKAEAEVRVKKEAEDKARAKDIGKRIADMKAEAERLSREAEALSKATDKAQTTATTPATEATATTTKAVNSASSDAWVVPTTPVTAAAHANKNASTDSKVDKDIYLQKGIIPEVDGRVVWTETFNVPRATADGLYGKAFTYLIELTQSDNQLSGSKVALVNKGEHSIMAAVREKLILSPSFLPLGYTQFNYVLQATCRDGQTILTMNRLTYCYDVQGSVSDLSAEQWITDKYAVSKKQARLLPVSDKFRRAAVDRKSSIFEGSAQALK